MKNGVDKTHSIAKPIECANLTAFAGASTLLAEAAISTGLKPSDEELELAGIALKLEVAVEGCADALLVASKSSFKCTGSFTEASIAVIPS